jgi:hypothetical protein
MSAGSTASGSSNDGAESDFSLNEAESEDGRTWDRTRDLPLQTSARGNGEPKSWRRRESSEWNGSTKRLGRFFYRKFLPIRVILLSQVRFPAS